MAKLKIRGLILHFCLYKNEQNSRCLFFLGQKKKTFMFKFFLLGIQERENNKVFYVCKKKKKSGILSVIFNTKELIIINH